VKYNFAKSVAHVFCRPPNPFGAPELLPQILFCTIPSLRLRLDELCDPGISAAVVFLEAAELFVRFRDIFLDYWNRYFPGIGKMFNPCFLGTCVQNRETYFATRFTFENSFPEENLVNSAGYRRAPLNVSTFEFSTVLFGGMFGLGKDMVYRVQFLFL